MERYKVVQEIHSNPRSVAGARIMSVVDEAGGKAAIKVVPKASVTEAKLRRLRDKKKALYETSECPFIEHLITTFQDTDNLYMVLSLVEGPTLWDVLRAQRRLCNEGGRAVCASVGLALGALNGRGFAHRDVKVTNVMVDTKRNRVVLIDTDSCGAFAGPGDRRTSIVGTRHCMAPEVLAGSHGTACDWWSLGTMLWEVMAGEPPFWEGPSLPPLEEQHGGKLGIPGCLHPDAAGALVSLLAVEEGARCRTVGGLRAQPWLDDAEFDWGGLESGEKQLPPTLSTQRVVFDSKV